MDTSSSIRHRFDVEIPRDKRRSENTNIEIEIGNEKISSTSSVKLLGVHIDVN